MTDDSTTSEKNPEKTGVFQKKQVQPDTAADMERVEEIVTRMKQKYSQSGMGMEEVGGKLSELRGIIVEGRQKEIEIQSIEELREFKQPIIRQLGMLYLALKNPLKPIMTLIMDSSMAKKLGYWIYSANMRFSVQQYLAITTSVGLIAFILTLAISTLLMVIFKIETYYLLLPLLFSLIAFGISVFICLYLPHSKAVSRGNSVSAELPFALRHMATELRSGIGLYRTIQAVAVADYGMLSEEFARTINEVEEGTETKEALSHLAYRTQSKQLKNAIMHIIRALKTGGNLSEVMNTIAKEVSFDLREKIRDFSEQLNFFGVIFIFGAIVFPVMVTVLGAIRNSPIPLPLNIPLDTTTLSLFYLLIMPAILLFFIFYVKSTQPKT